jgi:hypothetical protein
MIPPTLILSTDSDSTTNRPEIFQFTAESDPESLSPRRPNAISRARRTLDTIAESVTNLTGLLDGPARFFDGHMVDVRASFIANIDTRS